MLSMIMLSGGILHPSPCRAVLREPPHCTHYEGIVLLAPEGRQC
jgi:hypothetical protein